MTIIRPAPFSTPPQALAIWATVLVLTAPFTGHAVVSQYGRYCHDQALKSASMQRFHQAIDFEKQALSSYSLTQAQNSYPILNSRTYIASYNLALGDYKQAETGAAAVIDAEREKQFADKELGARAEQILADVYMDQGDFSLASACTRGVLAHDDLGDLSHFSSELGARCDAIAIRFEEGNFFGAELSLYQLLCDQHTDAGNCRSTKDSISIPVNATCNGFQINESTLIAGFKQAEAQNPGGRVLATYALNIGNLWHHCGNLAKAEQYFNMSLAIARSELGPEHPCTLRAMRKMGEVYFDQGKPNEAYSIIGAMLAARPGFPSGDSADRAATLILIGKINELQHHYGAAEESYKLALTQQNNTLGRFEPSTKATLARLEKLQRSY